MGKHRPKAIMSEIEYGFYYDYELEKCTVLSKSVHSIFHIPSFLLLKEDDSISFSDIQISSSVREERGLLAVRDN